MPHWSKRSLAQGMSGMVSLLCLLVVAAPSHPAQAAPPQAAAEPTWRFRDEDRPIKVVVVAGSIGAFKLKPYHQRLEQMCSEIEVQNISKTGAGAYELKRRFRDQVLKNRWLNLRNPDHEYWLMFNGGLNSVAMPEKTNRHIRELHVMAHKRGVKVVGLSLLPWGAESDKRWRGASGLKFRRDTQQVVDFVMGRSTPGVALGVHRQQRAEPDAPWAADELADVAVDLYDSDLRDRVATSRDVGKMRELLAKDSAWKKRHRDLTDEERTAQLEADAHVAATLPQWFMRSEFHAFDHIHPNSEGHRIMAETICPELPDNWGCNCPEPGHTAAPTD